jgi:hypothetical protein
MSAHCVERHGNVFYYEGTPGDHVSNNIKQVIADLQEKHAAMLLKFVMVKGSAEPVDLTGILKFNGKEIPMTRMSNWEHVEQEWHRMNDEESERWRASPEGIAYAAEREAARVARQEEMNVLWPKLQAVLQEYIDLKPDEGVQPTGTVAVALFDLLAPYILLSDWSNIETYRKECVELLKQCNYKSGEYIGPAELIDSGYKQRAFIAGRLISDFEQAGCFQPILEHMIIKAQLNTHNPIPYKPAVRPPRGKSPFDTEQ